MPEELRSFDDEDWMVETREKQYEEVLCEANVAQYKASSLMEKAGQYRQLLINSLHALFNSDYNLKYRCPKCGHEMDISCGGDAEEENYQVVCYGCNYVGTGVFMHQLAALLDWYDKCKHKENKDE